MEHSMRIMKNEQIVKNCQHLAKSGNIGQHLTDVWVTFRNCQDLISFGIVNSTFCQKTTNSCKHSEFGALQKCANLVDLEKCGMMNFGIEFHKTASILPRTNPTILYIHVSHPPYFEVHV